MATLRLKGKKTNKLESSSNFCKKEVLISIAVLGFILIALGLYLRYYNNILTFKHLSNYPEQTQGVVYAKPSKVRIPSVNIEIPIEDADIIDGIWETSKDKASYLVRSAALGRAGNVVIYGHNKEHIFAPLIDTEIGDDIFVSDEEGDIHIYKVTDIQVVDSDEVEVVLPTDYEVLTVYTCTGILDSKRLVIKASPVDFR